ncbi:MAG: DNA adenine methylase [Myxococcota bacterium]|nr:DNA adenine methylase [Myxococcota bacterium]
MIKYIGSKRLLVPRILEIVEAVPDVASVVDLFSGTSRVSHALKAPGRHVRANDHTAYAHALARCYVQADADRVAEPAAQALAEMVAAPPLANWFTRTYCQDARYLHPDNGVRIAGMRKWIADHEGALEPDVRAILLVALMEAADRVDSTTGVQMAYLKEWAPRARRAVAPRMPAVLSGGGEAYCMDAVDAAGRLEGDLAYIDPPYNQHSYVSNYHVWETLVRWDEPDTYGKACKRVDCRTRKSPFNSRRAIRGAFERLVAAARSPWLLVSFSDEAFLSRDALERILSGRGPLLVVEQGHPRYIGARIGIHSPTGVKVGTVSHTRNTERLYLVAPNAQALAVAAERLDAGTA